MKEKYAGVISAMLLGNKTFLDSDLKLLYQMNGIGHLLAISGLHVSVLCLSVYRILHFLRLPRPLPYIFSILFLILYGILTGFSISTMRAVIMLLFSITAKETGRSYDALSALAFSAVLTLLQKPYAVFSAAFLLSYAAVLGCILVYPALRTLWLGTCTEERARHRQYTRQLSERQKNSRFPKLRALIFSFPSKILSSFLFSLSVTIATLPIQLYFFYEAPTYGIILNLLVLPPVEACLVLALLGGFAGFFCMPLAALMLKGVEGILYYNETLCSIFMTFPKPVIILGRPEALQIILFLLLTAFLVFCSYYCRYERQSYPPLHRILWLAGLLAAVCVLLFPVPEKKLSVTILDVGQGDGIVLHSADGKTVLIDGGSSDSKNIGQYRIMPFLKYYGISKIDYMIMTHADEDHISGQLELMKYHRQNGIAIGCFLLPQPDLRCQDANYYAILKAAQKNRIPIQYICKGKSLHFKYFTLRCIHPENGFPAESANAYSTTLCLTGANFSMLFTGDLEKNGEAAVLEEIQKEESCYDFLKVPHHGSRNACSTAFLGAVRPVCSFISCGKNNRYGHPHAELLERLNTCKSRVIQTQNSGAIQLQSDGKEITVKTFCGKAYVWKPSGKDSHSPDIK